MSMAWVKDAVERLVRTYLQTLMGLVTADQLGFMNLDAFKAAAIAAIPAALSAAMSTMGVLRGDPESASLLRTVRDSVNC